MTNKNLKHWNYRGWTIHERGDFGERFDRKKGNVTVQHPVKDHYSDVLNAIDLEEKIK